MIRVLIVDDQALFRESLGHLIAREPDMEVGRQCAAVEEAIEALRGEKVDVVLASGRMGREFLEAARGAGAGESVLMITGGTEAEDSVAALQLGARGILSRSVSAGILTRAIRVVASGGAWVEPGTMELLLAGSPARESETPLTEREQRIVEAVCDGLTNRRIAEELGTSEGVIKAALRRLYVKAQASSRAQLVRRIVEERLGRKSRAGTR
jgi:DNA-binding NarL/FixJ family response regulator